MIKVEISLSGKVALVTGAAYGIGRATAMELARAGADVAVNDISDKVMSTKESIEKLRRKSCAAIFDVSDVNAVNAGIKQVRDALGPIDILINNVGIVDNLAPIIKMKSEKWDWEINVNLSGAFYCTKSVLPDMIRKGWGRIIMISSLGSLGINNQVAYAASKAGLCGIARAVTVEHSKDGITCNAILPGLIGTDRAKTYLPEAVKESARKIIPTGRMGEVEEVVNLVVFLSSEKASYITGSEMFVDGGAHIAALSYGNANFLEKSKL